MRRTRERNCGAVFKAVGTKECGRQNEDNNNNNNNNSNNNTCRSTTRRSRRESSTGARKIGTMSPSKFVRSTLLSLLVLGLISVEMFPLSSMAFVNNNCNPSRNNNNNNFETRIRLQINSCRKKDKQPTRTINFPLKKHAHSPTLSTTRLCMETDKNSDDLEVDEADGILGYDDDDDDLDDTEFLRKQLAHLESMEQMLEDIEEYCNIEGMCDDEDDDDNDNDNNNNNDEDDGGDGMFLGDDEDLDDMESLFDFLERTIGDVGSEEAELFLEMERQEEEEGNEENETPPNVSTATIAAAAASATAANPEPAASPGVPAAANTNANASANANAASFSPQGLEEALLQGVVPVDAGVGSNTLPGDFGFDPLGFAEKDYVQNFQYRFLDALPGGNPENDPPPEPRPSALVLRDYREAEIRHGRLAMLAVVIWPIQEKLDQLLLDPSECGPILYGPVTLPYFPLFMTLLMMLLGYLDIYTKDIQEEEGVGDAFLPGDCFWDPLSVLTGAPASMKKNMQERELFNGRVAMVAFAAFVFEEATSHEAIIDIPGNEVLFVPAYQIPSVQEWLDLQFSTI